jgi:ABC-type antimicrobial peptide transport system permease subunit
VLVLLAINRVPLKYTLRNLTVRWKTTLLTALAFTLVISLLVVMLAFVNGMKQMTEGTGQPNNVLVLADGATDESFSNLSAGDLAEIEALPQIEHDARTNRPLASRETYLIVTQPLPNAAKGRVQRRFLQVRGIENPAIAVQVHGVELLPGGSWFSEAGVQELPVGGAPAIQAVLGEGVAHELAGDRTPEERAAARNPDRLEVGDTFRIGQRSWLVTGIMASSGSTFNSEVWAKQSLIGPLFGKSNYTTLLLRTATPETARKLKDYLTNDYKKVAVNAQVEREYYASLSETNQQFTWAIGFVTVVMAIGGVFGVMNTMFAAISQRIKDIGILRLLGYGRWQILVSFLLESLVIALVGGLLGCVLGSLSDGWRASSIVSGHSAGGKLVVMELSVDAWVWAVGLFLTLLMGALGGLVPACSAMLKRPLEALR